MIRKKAKADEAVSNKPKKVEVKPSHSEHQTNKGQATEFAIQKIYVKDMSFESPNTPAVFRGQWKPEIHLELKTHHDKLDNHVYEVILQITATVKVEKDTAFLIELKKAGIFTISGLEGDALDHTLASFCPSIIFPYAREVIADMVVRGGFPQLNLAPINFEMVYQQSKKQQADQQGNKEQKVASTKQ